MKIKIVGIGKCGIRIAYDVFAHTRDLPSAYQIRIETNKNPYAVILNNLGVLESARKASSKMRKLFRDLMFDLNGVTRFVQEPDYVTIESDS